MNPESQSTGSLPGKQAPVNISKRIFLAVKIKPEPELMEVVDLLREELSEERIKWVDENQYHITLKFFGDTRESRIENITLAVEECCQQNKNFSFELCNPWYFRDREQLRVVLLQTAKTDALITFQTQLENRFSSIGIPKEDRAFKPHLTLGRIKSIRDNRRFYELMKQFPQKTLQTVLVSKIILFESILKPSGPEYLVLKKFKLPKD